MQALVYEPHCRHSVALSHSLQSHCVHNWLSLLACRFAILRRKRGAIMKSLFVSSCDTDWCLWVFVSSKQKWGKPAKCCIIRLLAPWRHNKAAILSLRESTASFVGNFFILKENLGLISCIWVLLSDSATLYGTLDGKLLLRTHLVPAENAVDAQLLRQPHLLPYRQGSQCSTVTSTSSLTLQTTQSMLNCYVNFISYLTDNAVNAQLFLQPDLLPYRQRSQCSTVSSAWSLTLQTKQSNLNSYFSVTA